MYIILAENIYLHIHITYLFLYDIYRKTSGI